METEVVPASADSRSQDERKGHYARTENLAAMGSSMHSHRFSTPGRLALSARAIADLEQKIDEDVHDYELECTTSMG